ncbi:hypothetical protein G436_2356 [Leptospira interrogans serovar Hardjo str. Norma]|uniref:Uncharacterized protein n=1 Tax=Leptospira interrogans serovar Hardjo str. Norma TaxID=1279460 RepID=A0A0M4N5W7_LEPIR|nr:hypothetical protein G436_2356 [Leptospira interrogans serovar Hardjo str. Norma]
MFRGKPIRFGPGNQFDASLYPRKIQGIILTDPEYLRYPNNQNSQ